MIKERIYIGGRRLPPYGVVNCNYVAGDIGMLADTDASQTHQYNILSE